MNKVKHRTPPLSVPASYKSGSNF